MQSGISFIVAWIVLLYLVFSLPLSICDCQVLWQFYSGTVFLHRCLYVTALFTKEEEEEEEKFICFVYGFLVLFFFFSACVFNTSLVRVFRC